MIATHNALSTALQDKDPTPPTTHTKMRATMTNKSTTTEPMSQYGRQPKALKVIILYSVSFILIIVVLG